MGTEREGGVSLCMKFESKIYIKNLMQLAYSSLCNYSMPQHTGSKNAPGTALQTPAHSFPEAHLQRTVSPSISCTGILIVPMHPACRPTTGVVVVIGEELIRPLSALGERFPLTLISQLAPPTTTLLQQQAENLLHSQYEIQEC